MTEGNSIFPELIPTCETDDEKAVWCSELQLRRELLKQVSLLGLFTWGTMPLTFSLAWAGAYLHLYLFLCTKFFATLAMQFKIRREIVMWFRRWRPNSESLVALEKSRDFCGFGLTAREIVLGLFLLTQTFFIGALDVVEAIDPDMDAMTPGNARNALTESQASAYADSWRDVPVLGNFLANLGLPGVLSAGLTVVCGWQLCGFLLLCADCKQIQQIDESMHRVQIDGRWTWQQERDIVTCFPILWKMRNAALDLQWAQASGQSGSEQAWANIWLDGGDCILYVYLFHLADCGNLLSIASHLRRIAVACVHEKHFPNDRLKSYRARVPEMVFQCWFTVSVLAFTAGGSSKLTLQKSAPIYVSIITSYAASFKAFWDVSKLLWNGATRHFVHPQTRILMALHALFYSMITIRLVGVWACPSHDFKITRLRCYP